MWLQYYAQVYRNEVTDVCYWFSKNNFKKYFLVKNKNVYKKGVKERDADRRRKQCGKIVTGKTDEEFMGIPPEWFFSSAVDFKEYQ